MNCAALLSNYHAERVLAWENGHPMTYGRFLSDVGALADLLPEKPTVINLADDRYRFLVGFAAETDALAENAARKLSEKNLDMIVANDVSQADAGFNVDTNRALLFFKNGSSSDSGLMSKDQLAGTILDHIATRLAGR